MGELMGSALAKPSDWVMVDLPRQLWAKSGRPARGTLIRVTAALTFVLAGLAIPGVVATVVLGAIGVAVFVALPPLVDKRLEALGEQLARTPKSEATEVLTKLEERKLVALFAPHAWVQLQRGRLHLILDDGRGAARAFQEAARVLGNTTEPRLMGAQAQGFTLSGDRKEARALLTELESKDALAPRDQLNLGIVYVEEPGKTERAIELLERAREELGSHPRTDGALALAYARADRLDDAVELIDAAEESDDALHADPLAAELVKRARKDVRQREGKAGRKTKKDRGDAGEAGEEAGKGRGKRKKKDRRKERRKKRKGRGAKDAGDEGADEDERPAESQKPTERIPKIAQADEASAGVADLMKKQVEAGREDAQRAREAAESVAGSLGSAAAEVARKQKAEQAALERARQEDARAKADAERVEQAKPAAPPKPAVAKPPTPPPLGGTSERPVFRPPPIPPPPKVGPAPKVAPPTLTAPKLKPLGKPPSLGKPATAAKKEDEPPADDGWGDLLGNDDDNKPG